MTPIFSSTIKVDCPDGPRYILKYPEKAFAITFPEWDVKVNALLKFYNMSETKVDPKILKRTKSIVKNLTENYASLQAHYQAAYLGWCGNPCSKEAEKAYNDAKTIICEREFTLKDLESKTSKIARKTELVPEPRQRAYSQSGGKRGGGRRPLPKVTYQRIIQVPETEIKNIQRLVSKLKV